MTIFILGLIIFLGIHSSRIIAPQMRAQLINSKGLKTWERLYTVLSLAGFALLVWGYGIARHDVTVLWVAPMWVKHIAALLTWVAFILFFSTHIPGNHFKAAVGHPMVLSVKIWAFAHLIANGRLPALILFVAFLVWSIVLYAVSRKRDRVEGVRYAPGNAQKTLVAVMVGSVVWAAFVFKLHVWLIGVAPISFAGGG